MYTLNRSETMVFALGGLGEVGKNLYCIEDENSITNIDYWKLYINNKPKEDLH